MKEESQEQAGNDAGSGRHERKRRAPGWVMALMLLGLGAAGAR